MVDSTKQNDFDELLKSLNEVAEQSDTLAKAAAPAPDDKQVAAAAAQAGAGGKGDGDGDEGEDDDEDDMVDATQLVKSLMERQDSNENVLAKALTGFTDIMSKQNKTIAAQGNLIKSLQTEVQALGGQGRGRKSQVAPIAKPGISDTLAKSHGADDGAITPADLLAKSNAAYSAGKLSGSEFNTVDVCLRNGWPIDAGILTKVASA